MIYYFEINTKLCCFKKFEYEEMSDTIVDNIVVQHLFCLKINFISHLIKVA